MAERFVAACSVGSVVGLEVFPNVEVSDVAEDSLDQPAEAQNEDPAIIQAKEWPPSQRVEGPTA